MSPVPGVHAAILLVEDNPTDVELTRFALEDAGHVGPLAVVEDGRDALAYLRSAPPFSDATAPDLVLLDIRLPLLDGPEVLREMRDDPALAHIAVVMLSADDDREGAMGAQSDRCDGYLVKPVSPDMLRGLLESLARPR